MHPYRKCVRIALIAVLFAGSPGPARADEGPRAEAPSLTTWARSATALASLAAGEVLVETEELPRGATVRAAARIDLPAKVIFATLTRCDAALGYVPHLKSCRVLETAADGSWARVEHVVDFGWYLPPKRYVFRAVYEPERRIRIMRESGALTVHEGNWELESLPDANATIVRYGVSVVAGFYVPRWFMRNTLKRDVPLLMRGLRAYRLEGT